MYFLNKKLAARSAKSFLSKKNPNSEICHFYGFCPRKIGFFFANIGFFFGKKIEKKSYLFLFSKPQNTESITRILRKERDR